MELLPSPTMTLLSSLYISEDHHKRLHVANFIGLARQYYRDVL